MLSQSTRLLWIEMSVHCRGIPGKWTSRDPDSPITQTSPCDSVMHAQGHAAAKAKLADLKGALGAAVRERDALAEEGARSGAHAAEAAAAAEAEAASLGKAMAALEARLAQQRKDGVCRGR